MMRACELELAVSAFATLSVQGLLRGVAQVSDGFNHPIAIACAAAVVGALLGCSVAIQALKSSRTTYHSLQALRLTRNRQVSADLVDAAQRTDTTLLISVAQDDTLFAFSQGFRKPRIVLSTGLINVLTRDELEAVLLHERAHVKRFDPTRALVARAFAHSLMFIPGFTEVLKAYLCRLELQADKAVVRVMQTPVPLASALYRLLALGAVDPVPGAVGLSPTDVRIDHLLGRPTSARLVMDRPAGVHVATFLAVLLVVGVLLLGSAHAISTCLPGAAPAC